MLRIFSEKFLIRCFYGKKILQARNWQSNQSWLENSRHQRLIANWLIKARRFCIITIWCEMKMGWNERGVKWFWGEMNAHRMNEIYFWFCTHYKFDRVNLGLQKTTCSFWKFIFLSVGCKYSPRSSQTKSLFEQHFIFHPIQDIKFNEFLVCQEPSKYIYFFQKISWTYIYILQVSDRHLNIGSTDDHF